MEKIIQNLLDKKASENNTIDLDAYAHGLQDMFASLQPQWIKIESEDDLPKESTLCNIFIEGKMSIAKYIGNNRWFLATNDYPKTTQKLSISHWMPISEQQPPKD